MSKRPPGTAAEAACQVGSVSVGSKCWCEGWILGIGVLEGDDVSRNGKVEIVTMDVNVKRNEQP